MLSIRLSGVSLDDSDVAGRITSFDPGRGIRSLAAGSSSSCTISVSFKPKTKGSLSATLTITDNVQSGTQKVRCQEPDTKSRRGD